MYKLIFLLAMVILNFISMGFILAEEETNLKNISIYILPDVKVEESLITKVRVLIENTGDKPCWVRQKDIDADTLRVYTEIDDKSIKSGGYKRVTSHGASENEEDEYIKILPKSIYGKVIELTEKKYIKWADYTSKKISISVSIRVKTEIDKNDPENIQFKAYLIQTSSLINTTKSNEEIENKK